MAITDKKNKVADGIAPIFIGLTIGAVGMSFGHNCGFSLNPARDFGPRYAVIIHLLFILKQFSEFSQQWSMAVMFSLLTISISGSQLLDHMLVVPLQVFSTNTLSRYFQSVQKRSMAPVMIHIIKMPHVVSQSNFYISEIQRRIHRSPTRTRTQLEKEDYLPSAFLSLDLRQTPSKSIGYFDNCTSEFRLRTKSASNKNSKFSFRLTCPCLNA